VLKNKNQKTCQVDGRKINIGFPLYYKGKVDLSEGRDLGFFYLISVSHLCIHDTTNCPTQMGATLHNYEDSLTDIGNSSHPCIGLL
jgi:hypothetical protein